jgi:hypothetical protein
MCALRPLTIQSSYIKAEIDNHPSLPQTYTFGPTVTNQWIAVGEGTNTIYYSNNGVAWSPVTNNVFAGGTGLGVAWNGSRWVACGTGVTSLAYSDTNVAIWNAVASPSLTTIYSVIWDGTKWFAVGLGGGKWIITSANGSVWTDITTNLSLTTCYGIAWNGSILVAVGEGNTILYSNPYSYTTWNGTTNPFSTSGHGVAWNGRIWVAVGEGGSTIRYSTDAQTWTNASGTLFSTAGYGIAWSGAMWAAVGKGGTFVVYSNDGITWESGSVINLGSITITQFNSVAWNGTAWVATVESPSGGYTANSYDGITWKIATTPIFGITIHNAAFNNRRRYTLSFSTNSTIGQIAPFSASSPRTIAVGSYFYGSATSAVVAYSSDGISWTVATSANTYLGRGNGVVWNGSIWVVVGGTGVHSAIPPQPNTIIYSSDGINWLPSSNGLSVLTIGNGVAWNGRQFVAVGSGQPIVYSSDGVTWNIAANGETIFGFANGITTNGSRWVAVGGSVNSIGYSSDGTNWTSVTNSTSLMSLGYGVVWSGTQFVAVGYGVNTILYSSDGITWTPSVNGNSVLNDGRAIAWNGLQYVAVGSSIVYSSDGTNWTNSPSGSAIFSGGECFGVTWNGTRWVATGYGSNPNVNPSFAYSTDGINWTAGQNIFTYEGDGIASNFSSYNLISILNNNSLDVVSDAYYNTGYTNFSMTARSQYS